MNEFDFIRRYFAQSLTTDDVALGIGDDCALLTPPVGRQLAISVDTLVSGVHFLPNTAPHDIATRAMCVALSDLAAMGASAHWFTLALSLPKEHANAQWIEDFCKGLFTVAKQYQCSLIGGDLTQGPLTVTVQVHGSVEPGKALLRSGAQPGDAIYVTGCLGDGAAALALLKGELDIHGNNRARDYLNSRFFRPEPRLALVQEILPHAHAAIDISDGLQADLAHICTASNVGACINLDALPLSPKWSDYTSADTQRKWALGGGDDYEICFTAPEDSPLKDSHLPITIIGKTTQEKGIKYRHDQQEYALNTPGYLHFV